MRIYLNQTDDICWEARCHMLPENSFFIERFGEGKGRKNIYTKF